MDVGTDQVDAEVDRMSDDEDRDEDEPLSTARGRAQLIDD